MKPDTFVAGLLEAESTHGLRYTKLIAEGDISVSELQEQ